MSDPTSNPLKILFVSVNAGSGAIVGAAAGIAFSIGRMTAFPDSSTTIAMILIVGLPTNAAFLALVGAVIGACAKWFTGQSAFSGSVDRAVLWSAIGLAVLIRGLVGAYTVRLS